jgi:hypothetical protein
VTIIKFSVSFDLSANAAPINPAGDMFFFTSPTRNLFKTAVVQPIEKLLAERPALDLVKFSVMIAGNDFFLGNCLLVYLQQRLENPVTFGKAVLTFFLFPLGSSHNSLADYLAHEDPVYHLMVHNVFWTIASISPTLNENAQVTFASIEDERQRYETHLWFSNPSPSSALQFGIQHYLLFAREVLHVRVWKVEMILDSKTMVVPFVSSLHISAPSSTLPSNPATRSLRGASKSSDTSQTRPSGANRRG